MNRMYGYENECKLEQFFLHTYDCKRTQGQYNYFDFENDTTLIELKSRRLCKDAYYDTMIGANKVEKGLLELHLKRKHTIMFFFLFLDGLYFYELDKENIGLLRKDYYNGIPYYFIPVHMLTKVEEY